MQRLKDPETLKKLGMGYTTARKEIAKGNLRAHLVANTLWLSDEAIEEYWAKHELKPINQKRLAQKITTDAKGMGSPGGNRKPLSKSKVSATPPVPGQPSEAAPKPWRAK